MPTTERVRRFMCAVCHNRAKGRPGLRLPSHGVACEQCTAEIKKSVRSELELEGPTKRFLVRYATELSSQLPSDMVKTAMRKARAHAAGKIKITKRILSAAERKKLQSSQFAIPETKSYPIHDEVHARNALARVAQHGSDEEKTKVRAAVRRKYPNIEISKSENDIDLSLTKSQPDTGDVHVEGLLGNDDEGDGICMFKSPAELDKLLEELGEDNNGD